MANAVKREAVLQPDKKAGHVSSFSRNAELEAKLTTLPTSPGVYKFTDHTGTVIYVGKANNLRARVRQYARGGDGRAQIRFLLAQLTDVEVIVTQTEKEALLLEDTLIKQFRPRYNIRLKDNSAYWHVKVTQHDRWPRLLLTRQIAKDGSKYLGPFHSSTAVQETLEIIRRVFPLRTCTDTVFRNRTRPCLEYQIKRCLGPLYPAGRSRRLSAPTEKCPAIARRQKHPTDRPPHPADEPGRRRATF